MYYRNMLFQTLQTCLGWKNVRELSDGRSPDANLFWKGLTDGQFERKLVSVFHLRCLTNLLGLFETNYAHF